MGNTPHKREGYADFKYIEEKELRQFEEDELKGFKRPLNSVLQRSLVEQDVISIAGVEEMAIQDFSETFLSFVQQGYFYKNINGKKYYDAKKIKLLLFLLSEDTIVSNSRVKYHDKASFIFNYVKIREDEDLSMPIERENEAFLNFIHDIIEISCIGIVDSFIGAKNVKREGYLLKFKDIQDAIGKKFVDALFTPKSKTASKVLSFEELNSRFEENKYLFTAGDIREFGWYILSDEGKAAEMDTKEREEMLNQK